MLMSIFGRENVCKTYPSHPNSQVADPAAAAQISVLSTTTTGFLALCLAVTSGREERVGIRMPFLVVTVTPSSLETTTTTTTSVTILARTTKTANAPTRSPNKAIPPTRRRARLKAGVCCPGAVGDQGEILTFKALDYRAAVGLPKGAL